FCLPYSTGQNRIQGSKYLDRIKYLETEDLQVKGGLNSFTVIANSMKSGLGDVYFTAPINFLKKGDERYYFTAKNDAQNALNLDMLNLGQLIERKDLGIVNGKFNLAGYLGGRQRLELTEISGNVDRFDFMDVAYNGIDIKEGIFAE